MEATQKRRIWKVAIIHFLLTAFAILFLALTFFGFIPDTKNQFLVFGERIFFSILQPQFWIVPTFMDVESFFASISEISIFLSWAAFLVCLFSIPLWSLCFGWIYVRLSDRLNHFFSARKKDFLKSAIVNRQS
jgi:hypothetical protein